MMSARLILLALSMLTLSVTTGAAATVRSFVHVVGPVVRLSDLFEDLETGQDCTLGDGPAAGGRLVIEQPQLEAIALQFGVAWEPSRGNQTVVLEREGRAVSRADVVSMLKDALNQRLAIKNSVVTLPSFDELTVDAGASISVEDVSIDQSDGQFGAALVTYVNGREISRAKLNGTVDRLVDLTSPSHPIAQGEILVDRDLTIVQMPAGHVHGDTLSRSDDAVGWMATRPLAPGVPIVRSDLRRPDLVVRGGPVLMRLTTGGIEVVGQGQSLEAGIMGGWVRVLNPVSHAVLLASVIGQNQVRIDPDSTPLARSDSTSFPSGVVVGSLAQSDYNRYGAFGSSGVER